MSEQGLSGRVQLHQSETTETLPKNTRLDHHNDPPGVEHRNTVKSFRNRPVITGSVLADRLSYLVHLCFPQLPIKYFLAWNTGSLSGRHCAQWSFTTVVFNIPRHPSAETIILPQGWRSQWESANAEGEKKEEDLGAWENARHCVSRVMHVLVWKGWILDGDGCIIYSGMKVSWKRMWKSWVLFTRLTFSFLLLIIVDPAEEETNKS